MLFMTDFEKMIRDEMANGTSPEDIAKATTEVLNRIQKERDEVKSLSREYYKQLEEQFHKSYASGHLGIEDVGILATLVVAPNYPNWKVLDMVEFKDGVVDMLKMRAELIGKSPLEGLFKALDMAEEWGKEKVNGVKDKVGEKAPDPDKKCGVDRICTCKNSKTDAQKIREFLKSFDF